MVDTGMSSALNNILSTLVKAENIDTEALYWLIFLVLGTAVPQLFYPLAGWIADARVGRYKVMRVSIWCMWLGQCLLSLTFLLYLLLPKASASNYMKYAVHVFTFPLAFVTINVGLAGFQANAMQFGVDQMVDLSGDEVSSFIHWYYWSTNFGGAMLSTFLSPVLEGYSLSTLVAGVNVLLMGCSLLLWYKLRDWFIIEPHGENPFKTVYDVIRFALKHRSPLYRSALTYWDDRPLPRLDLGKNKYGGPFTTEEVEDVKSFLAILVVMASLGMFMITDNSLGTPLLHQMRSHALISDTKYTDGNLASSLSINVLFWVSIPVYELVICPLMKSCHCQLTIMKRIGIGMMIAILSQVMCLTLYEIAFHRTQDKNYCFLFNSTGAINASVSASAIAVPFVFSTLAELVVYIAAFEFICAQSPYRFRGMLVGTFYAFEGLCSAAVSLFAVALTNGHGNRPWSVSGGCGTVYYSVMLAIAVIGLAFYMLAGWMYIPRERDEHIDHHMIAENYYSSSL